MPDIYIYIYIYICICVLLIFLVSPHNFLYLLSPPRTCTDLKGMGNFLNPTYQFVSPRISSYVLVLPRISIFVPRISLYLLGRRLLSSYLLISPRISSYFIAFPSSSSYLLSSKLYWVWHWALTFQAWFVNLLHFFIFFHGSPPISLQLLTTPDIPVSPHNFLYLLLSPHTCFNLKAMGHFFYLTY